MELDPDVRAYYEQGREAGRLLGGGSPAGPLELERTRELVLRHLPSAPCRILDVGGGAGVHASWLAELGHDVELIDPVPLHVDQATDAGLRAEVGDARALDRPDASVDAVLLLGPLYHLPEATDRATALAEARRVLRPGGWLFAAAIARFAALFDNLVEHDRYGPDTADAIDEATRTGVLQAGTPAGFTLSYLHLPTELRREVAAAGFEDVQVLNVEGPGFLTDAAARWDDPARREALLRAARLVESEPEMMGAAAHLLAVAQRPLEDLAYRWTPSVTGRPGEPVSGRPPHEHADDASLLREA